MHASPSTSTADGAQHSALWRLVAMGSLVGSLCVLVASAWT
jgi:hypothetical protein